MRFYPFTLVACAMLLMAAGAAAATGRTVSVTVPSSFAISEFGKAVDNGSGEYGPGPGPIAFFRGGDALYVRVPAQACIGMRLVTLEDRESGITFRNNTLLLPICAAGMPAGSLIATTDNLSADSSGYVGQVTGLELDLPGGTAGRDGTNYTAGAAVLLKDLPAGETYLVSFGDNDTALEAIAAGRDERNRAIAAISPILSIGSASRAGEDAVDCVIVTIQAGRDRSGLRDAGNASLYWYNYSGLSGLRTQAIRTENSTTYQAVAPGPGQFALVAAGTRDATTEATAPAPGDVQILGLTLAVLLVALAIMVRRVARR